MYISILIYVYQFFSFIGLPGRFASTMIRKSLVCMHIHTYRDTIYTLVYMIKTLTKYLSNVFVIILVNVPGRLASTMMRKSRWIGTTPSPTWPPSC